MTTNRIFDGKGQVVDQQALFTLKASLHGELVLPGDNDFQAARIVWNKAIDRNPALIIRCANVADVITSVNFAREHDLVVSVRSGGHSLAGHSTNDGGMVIDLSRMKAIAIDPIQRTARIEPGLTWSEVAVATHPYGLALTSGDTGSVGVGGLLVGGGMGWMVRKYGLTIDRLRAVELVTSDGQFLRASADEHAELFWGLRGGGGNFGVVTAFEVDLHPGGTVLGGAIFYDATDAERLISTYTHYAATAPDELTTEALLLFVPSAPFLPKEQQNKPVFAILLCYTGDITEGERVVAPLRTLGTPLADLIAPIPYPSMFSLTGDENAPELEHDGRSLLLASINEDALHTLVRETRAFLMAPGIVAQIRLLGGAMSHVAKDATAFAHRDAQAMIMVAYVGPKSARAELRAAMEHIWQAMRPYSTGVYVNFVGDEGDQRIHEAYPPAIYARLAALKNRYDPINLFHLNQNIVPTLNS